MLPSRTQHQKFGLPIKFKFEQLKSQCLGDTSDEVTPVPIPNTAVKLLCANDSRKAKVGRRQDNDSFFIL